LLDSLLQERYFAMDGQDFRNVPVYRGAVKACVFDWAGTVCDAGVFAPVLTFQQLFEEEGVPITAEEVRAPMGVHKRIHIQRICQLPEVKKRWTDKRGKAPTNDDAERIYLKSLTATLDLLPTNSKLIRGIPQTMAKLRSDFGLKIGSSTGYTSEIMAKLRPLAAAEGYAPDSYVTSDEVPSARPGPNMIFLNMVKLDVFPAQAVVKVDDSGPGIIAGLNAGCWTVGIAKTGNYVGMTEAEMDAADPKELAAKVKKAEDILYQAGAHFVIATTVDLPPVIAEINRRLAMGIKP
jgi:phosphonoacetaldehyde hydrolase